ncbi:MAG: tetratricopeptide repeat protein [Pseudomonadota bacterium]
MESYRTEDEQVEALRRWWQENGRSTVIAIVVAVSGALGWQAWQGHQVDRQEDASNLYQSMLTLLGQGAESSDQIAALADQLKEDFGNTTYAQFAALQLASQAVKVGDLTAAESQLRWVLTKAAKGSDVAQLAQLRLARVIAESGETEQALVILAEDPGAYAASYAVARGDVLLADGRRQEALASYNEALIAASTGGLGVSLPSLQVKIQSLTPVPSNELGDLDTVPEDVTEENSVSEPVDPPVGELTEPTTETP